MTNLIAKIYHRFLIKRYTKNAKIFGTMLSYSYMGEPVGYKRAQALNLKYALKLLHKNIRPWSYEEMARVGWGKLLPELTFFNSVEEKQRWLMEQKDSENYTQFLHEIDLANRLLNQTSSTD